MLRKVVAQTIETDARMYHIKGESPPIEKIVGAKLYDAFVNYVPVISEKTLPTSGKHSLLDVFKYSDRNEKVMASIKRVAWAGVLSTTGKYLSFFPVDQGIEHSGINSFYKNLDYFNPETIIKRALDFGCSGVFTTINGLGMNSKKYAHQIPLGVKLNHNLGSFTPGAKPHQVMVTTAKQAFNLGATMVGATIFFGSPTVEQEIHEVSTAFNEAHNLGMMTVLWAYARSDKFKVEIGKDEKDKPIIVDLHSSAVITGQANHLASTIIPADIIKQKAVNMMGLKPGKESMALMGVSNLDKYENLYNAFIARFEELLASGMDPKI
ncbi:MAG: hypothetical protein AABZ14_04780, partial [Candidatus Margulisiibacteriota bacterium]